MKDQEKRGTEISLFDILITIRKYKKLLLINSIIFLIIGLIIALTSTKEYKASATILPLIPNNVNPTESLIKNFSGLSGINLSGSNSEALLPELYPMICESTPFLMKISEEKVFFSSEDSSMEVGDYFVKHKKGIWSLLNFSGDEELEEVKGAEPLKLSPAKMDEILLLKDRIDANTDIESGTLTISATMPDPVVAAVVTERSLHYLKDYIINYRTEKAKQDLEFIKKRYAEAKSKYEEAQMQLAKFRDQHANIYTNILRTREERLIAENDLAFDLYNSLAKELEQAKIQIQKETPVFKVLHPVVVPTEKSAPNRKLIIAVSLLLGLILSGAYIFIKELWIHLKQL